MPVKLLLLLILLTPSIAQADGLQLTSIPFVTQGGLSGVIQGLFLLAIVVAGMLAVVKLVIAGAKYMMSDVVTTKQSAIGDIKGAIIGLLLILGTVLILDTINDQITNANLSLESLNLEGSEWSFEDPNNPENGQGSGDGMVDVTELTAAELNTAIDECQSEGGEFVTQPPNDDGSIMGGCTSDEEGDEAVVGYIDGDGDQVTIDPETVYTVNEPAIEEFGLEEGEYHNQSGTIIGVVNAPTISEDIDDVDTDVLEVEITGPILFEIELDSGEVITMPCGLLDPPGPSC